MWEIRWKALNELHSMENSKVQISVPHIIQAMERGNRILKLSYRNFLF